MPPSFIVVASCALALAACSVSCASSQDRDGFASPSPSTSSTPPAGTAGGMPCGPSGPRHHAFLASGACTDLPGTSGKWISRPLFPDAPEPTRSRACTYRWSTIASAPEVSLLAALPKEHLTPNCEPGDEGAATPRGVATLLPAPQGDGGLSAPTGVVGCDVCARLEDTRVFVILPPDAFKLRNVTVATDGGRLLSFGITPPATGVQAFAVELPAAPLGTTYVRGAVPVFEGPPR